MERERKIIKTSIIGILANVSLVIFKALVGFFTNSIAVILDAVNNLTDVISSVVTIIGTKLAGKAPDKEHPYGHGRIEYLTSLAVSEIILIAGIMAIKESIEKLIYPEEIDYSPISMIIIAVAVVVKYILGTYVKGCGRRLKSQSLVASGQDAYMDAVLGFTTLVAAIINYIWKLSLEGYLGIIIGLVIIKSAISILKETINAMIGQREDAKTTEEIKKKVCSYDKVQGAYDLVLHNYGPSKTIGTVHIQVPDEMRADEIHILTRQISMDVFNEYGVILTVGIYAANDKKQYNEIKDVLTGFINEFEDLKQIHGFYVDEASKNIYFDLIIDFKSDNQEELRNRIINEMEKKYPEYKFNVILDADYSE